MFFFFYWFQQKQLYLIFYSESLERFLHFLLTSRRICRLFCMSVLFFSNDTIPGGVTGLNPKLASTMGEGCCRWPTRDRTRTEASFLSPLGRRRIWTVDTPSSADLWRAWMCVSGSGGIGDRSTLFSNNFFQFFIEDIVCKK